MTRRGWAWERITLVVIASFSALLSLLLAWRYPGGMNPDGISYLDLASSWADGRLTDAINGYWSALLPLAMAPLQALGAGNTLTFAVVGAITAFGVVIFVYLLLQKLGVQEWVAIGLAAIVALRASVWAVEVWTPDLLFAGLGLCATLFAVKLRSGSTTRSWFIFGISCGVLYLAKPVGLLTGVSMGALVWFVWSAPDIRANFNIAAQRLVALVSGWATVTVPMIALLSLKYGHLTIGSSGGYNLALTNWLGRPSPSHLRLYTPPFEGATSVGTDPWFIDFHLPFSVVSSDGIQLIFTNISRNADKLWDTQRGWLTIAVLCLAGIVVLSFRERTLPKDLAIVLGIALIQSLVYLPVLFESRYLLLAMVLLATLATAVVSRLIVESRLQKAGLFATVAIVSFCLFPGTTSKLIHAENPVPLVLSTLESRHETAIMTQDINERLDLPNQSCARIASLSNEERSYLHVVLLLAEKNSWFSSGNIQQSWSGEEMVREVRENQVDCVIHWNNAEMPAELAATLTIIADTGDGWIKVYRVNP